MNYKEDKGFRRAFENFVCLRLLQNFNKPALELDKAFSECLVKVYGTSCFENLRKIGIAIENSQSKLKPGFEELLQKCKAERPGLVFDFLLVDDLKRLQMADLPLAPAPGMAFFQNLFHDFYYNHFNNTYKKCDFSLTLGTLEFGVKIGGREFELLTFPMDGLILMQISKKKGIQIRELWQLLKNSEKTDSQRLFLKCLKRLKSRGVVRRQDLGFSGLASHQLTFECRVQIDRGFFKTAGKSRFSLEGDPNPRDRLDQDAPLETPTGVPLGPDGQADVQVQHRSLRRPGPEDEQGAGV